VITIAVHADVAATGELQQITIINLLRRLLRVVKNFVGTADLRRTFFGTDPQPFLGLAGLLPRHTFLAVLRRL
jgi:hypothetical protein